VPDVDQEMVREIWNAEVAVVCKRSGMADGGGYVVQRECVKRLWECEEHSRTRFNNRRKGVEQSMFTPGDNERDNRPR